LKRVKLGESPEVIGLPFEAEIPSRPLALPRAKQPDREEQFFGSAPTLASRVKTKILVDSFMGWASVMLNANPVTLWYVDLYCGRGTYKEDGSWATPLQLFDKVSRDRRLPGVLKMLFNDSREASVFQLRDSLMAHPDFAAMRYPPRFNVGEVNEEMVVELTKHFPQTPTYAFIDPFGYKGLTQNVIHTILQRYGCDVMFFFSYHVIKRAIRNANNKLRGHVEALLGRQRVALLREMMVNDVPERELESAVLRALAESMRAIDGQTVVTFAFRRSTGHASHHLAFVSKHPRGFEVAKEAMARNSSWWYDDNIPSLEYMRPGFDNALLHVDPPTITKLMFLLVDRLGAQTVTLDEAYASVLYVPPYYKPNVREALVRLVRDHHALLYSDGQPAKLRGTKLPRNPKIRIPLRITI
jgi:three-Cys-motif partner protein